MIHLAFKKAALAGAVAATLVLGGCAEGRNEGGATMVGAGLGALFGSQMGGGHGRHGGGGSATGAVIGAIGGAMVGNAIGRNMDQVDRMKARDAQQRAYAAPLNEPIIWNNPNTGNSGRVTPIRDGRRASGQYCREFQTEITISGRREDAHGTACQQPDGSWKIVEG